MQHSDSRNDFCYIAGLVDGDGTIFISKKTYSNKKEFRLLFTITSTNKSVIEFIKRKFKVGNIYFNNPINKKHKPSWRFDAWHGDAILIISQIQQYLIVKKEQAKLALSFISNIRKNGDISKLSDDESNTRLIAYEKMRELNKTNVFLDKFLKLENSKSFNIISNLCDIDKFSYIAGIIDSEGCLTISKKKDPTMKIGYGLRVFVTISNTNKVLLYELMNAIGAGNLSIKTHKGKILGWAYGVWSKGAIHLLENVGNLLIIKNKQAKIILKFGKCLIYKKEKTKKLLLNKQNIFYEKIKLLNKRGL